MESPDANEEKFMGPLLGGVTDYGVLPDIKLPPYYDGNVSSCSTVFSEVVAPIG